MGKTTFLQELISTITDEDLANGYTPNDSTNILQNGNPIDTISLIIPNNDPKTPVIISGCCGSYSDDLWGVDDPGLDISTNLFLQQCSECNESEIVLPVQPHELPLDDPVHDIYGILSLKQKAKPPTHVNVPNITEGLGKRQDKRDLVDLEQFIVRKMTLMVYHEQLYEFAPPCWKLLSPRKCAVRLRKLLDPHSLTDALTTKEYQEIHRLLLTNPNIQREVDFIPPQHCLNLSDGTLDLITMQLFPHNPDNGFFTYLDMSYDELRAPGNGFVFERFATQIGDGNSAVRQQLLELVALAITGYEAKQFYVLIGPSNTGKTQFGRFLEELLGRENVESIAGVHDFSNRFTTSALAGKRLGTCLDLPDTPLPSVAIGTIKQFVGDDPIKIEQKYKDSRTIYQKPLLLFAGNHPIRLPNISQEQALLNRMVVIPFANPVEEAAMTQQLYKTLLDEAPYIVAKAIKAYQALMERNFVVTRLELPEEYTPRDSRQKFSEVGYFLEACCEYDEANEVSTDALYQAYRLFVDKEALISVSKIEFSRLLAENLNAQQRKVEPLKRVSSTQGRGYKGIALCQ